MKIKVNNMKKKFRNRSNQKTKRKSAGTNKGTSGRQREFYANLYHRSSLFN